MLLMLYQPLSPLTHLLLADERVMETSGIFPPFCLVGSYSYRLNEYASSASCFSKSYRSDPWSKEAVGSTFIFTVQSLWNASHGVQPVVKDAKECTSLHSTSKNLRPASKVCTQ